MAAKGRQLLVIANPDDGRSSPYSLVPADPGTSSHQSHTKIRRHKALRNQNSAVNLKEPGAGGASGSGQGATTQRVRSAGHTPASQSAAAAAAVTPSPAASSSSSSGPQHTPPAHSPVSPHVYGAGVGGSAPSFDRERGVSPTTEQQDPFSLYPHPPPPSQQQQQQHPSQAMHLLHGHYSHLQSPPPPPPPPPPQQHHRSGSSTSVIEISPVANGHAPSAGSYHEQVPTERKQIQATLDGNDYVPVDITGLQGATAIRERICEMLGIPVYPSALPALYRIEFAMPPSQAKERAEISDGLLIELSHRSAAQLRYYVEPRTGSPEGMLSPSSAGTGMGMGMSNGLGGGHVHRRASPSFSAGSSSTAMSPGAHLSYSQSYTPGMDHSWVREQQYAQAMQQQQQSQQQQQQIGQQPLSHSPQQLQPPQLHPPAIPPRDPSRERARPKTGTGSTGPSPSHTPTPGSTPSSTPTPYSAPQGGGFDLPMLGPAGHHERSFSDTVGGGSGSGGGSRGWLSVGGGNGGIPVIPVQMQRGDWGDMYAVPDGVGMEPPQVPEKKRGGVIGVGSGKREGDREREQRDREAQRERERQRRPLQTNNLPPTTTSRNPARLHSPTTTPTGVNAMSRGPSLSSSKSYSQLRPPPSSQPRPPLPYGPSPPVVPRRSTAAAGADSSRAYSPVQPTPTVPPQPYGAAVGGKQPYRFGQGSGSYTAQQAPAPASAVQGYGPGMSPVSPQQTRRQNGAFGESSPAGVSTPTSGGAYSDHSQTPTSALPTPPHTNIPSSTSREHGMRVHEPLPTPPVPSPAHTLPSPPPTNVVPSSVRPRYVPFDNPQAPSDTTNMNAHRQSPLAVSPPPTTPSTPSGAGGGGASLVRSQGRVHHGGPRPIHPHSRRESEGYGGLAPSRAPASTTPTPDDGGSPSSPSPRSSAGGPPTPGNSDPDVGAIVEEEEEGSEREEKRRKRKAMEFPGGVNLERRMTEGGGMEDGMLPPVSPPGDVEGLMETVIQSMHQLMGHPPDLHDHDHDPAGRTVVPPLRRPPSTAPPPISVSSKPPSPQPPTMQLSTPTLPLSIRTLPQPHGQFLPIQAMPSDDLVDDDDDPDGGTIWKVPPHRANTPSASVGLTPGSAPAVITIVKPKVPPIRTDPSINSAPPRASPRTETWGQLRPAAEEILENLDHFFPGHDLDAPVVDATSADGSSPTDRTEVILPPAPSTAKLQHLQTRQKRAKSIRDKAMEKGKRMQLEKMEIREEEGGAGAGEGKVLVKRKRTTKIWNHKIEELKPGADLPPVPEVPPLPGPSPDSDEETMTFSKGALIGKGTYGRVYLAILVKTGDICAVKQVELPKTDYDKQDSKQLVVVEAIKSEREVLQDLEHRNIVQYLGYSQSHDNDTGQDFFNLFLEYVPGGSIGHTLRKWGKFREDIIQNITGQILEGLAYLHAVGIVHRDLKADNILIDQSWTCKISDFGTSKRSDDAYRNQEATLMQGSIPWMAPEVLLKQGDGYGAKVDIWSLGCVFLEMWAGVRPWSDQEIFPIMFKVAQERQAPPVPPGINLTEGAEAFRLRCCAIDPDDRPTAAVLRQDAYLVLPEGWEFPPFPGTVKAQQQQQQATITEIPEGTLRP